LAVNEPPRPVEGAKLWRRSCGLLLWRSTGFHMGKLPRHLEYDRSGVGGAAFVTEALGELGCAQFKPADQGAGIAQHQAPGPDFPVARERHADGSVNAWCRGMSGAGGVRDHIFLE